MSPSEAAEGRFWPELDQLGQRGYENGLFYGNENTKILFLGVGRSYSVTRPGTLHPNGL